MSSSILIVFLLALLQLVAGGRDYGFGGYAIANTLAEAKVKGKYGKGFSKGLATGTGIAVGPNAKADSASYALAAKGFAKASSVASASVGYKKGCKDDYDCDDGYYEKDCDKEKCDDGYYEKDCDKEKCDD